MPPQARRMMARAGGYFNGLFADVQWTAAYIGLLMYVFSVVTYRFPLATPGMLLALVGVFVFQTRIRVPGVLMAFGAFIIWGVISYTQSAYPAVAWDRLNLLSKNWIIAFVAVNALRTRGQIRFFVVFFLVCFATHPARGAIFNYLGGYTVYGRALWNHIYANPNDLAALTLLPLGLAIGLMRDVNIWVRRGAIVSVVVLSALVLMTQSRGGFLALSLMAVLAWQTQKKKMKGIAVGFVLAAAAVIIAPAGVWERVATLSEGSEADSSSRQRWEIWQVAREIAAENPVYGVGPGAYRFAHYERTLGNPRFPLSPGTRDTHSTYLNVLAEFGWPGLVLFLLIIALALNEAVRARRTLPGDAAERTMISALALALVAFLLTGVFGSFAQLSFLYLQIALLTVLSRYVIDEATQNARYWRRARHLASTQGRQAMHGSAAHGQNW